MQQLKDQVDDGKIDTNRLERTVGTSFTLSDSTFINKFERHVERGGFAEKLDLKVADDMRERRSAATDKETEYQFMRKKQRAERLADKANKSE